MRQSAQREADFAVLMEPSDGGYLMVISDDGDGFSPERIDRPEPGHLGLSAMRGRAERAGGWWRVDSQPGRGTAIEFWLPGRRGVGDPNGPAPASTGVAS